MGEIQNILEEIESGEEEEQGDSIFSGLELRDKNEKKEKDKVNRHAKYHLHVPQPGTQLSKKKQSNRKYNLSTCAIRSNNSI